MSDDLEQKIRDELRLFPDKEYLIDAIRAVLDMKPPSLSSYNASSDEVSYIKGWAVAKAQAVVAIAEELGVE